MRRVAGLAARAADAALGPWRAQTALQRLGMDAGEARGLVPAISRGFSAAGSAPEAQPAAAEPPPQPRMKLQLVKSDRPLRPWEIPREPKPVDLPKTALTLETRERQPGSRRSGLLAVKCGMTCDWTEWGERIPLTVLWIDDCQARRRDLDGLEYRVECFTSSGWSSAAAAFPHPQAGGAGEDRCERGVHGCPGRGGQQEGEAGGVLTEKRCRQFAMTFPPREAPHALRLMQHALSLPTQLTAPERGHFRAAEVPYKRELAEFRVRSAPAGGRARPPSSLSPLGFRPLGRASRPDLALNRGAPSPGDGGRPAACRDRAQRGALCRRAEGGRGGHHPRPRLRRRHETVRESGAPSPCSSASPPLWLRRFRVLLTFCPATQSLRDVGGASPHPAQPRVPGPGRLPRQLRLPPRHRLHGQPPGPRPRVEGEEDAREDGGGPPHGAELRRVQGARGAKRRTIPGRDAARGRGRNNALARSS